MITDTANRGAGRRRIVLHLAHGQANPAAMRAAIRLARAFEAEIDSLFIEDSDLIDMASLPFAREISLSGRSSRPLSRELIERQMQAAAAGLARRLEDLARLAEVPFQMRVVRGQPITVLTAACATCGPENAVVLAEPLQPSDGALIARLFRSLPAATGLIVVGRGNGRGNGRIIGLVEDIDHFEAVLRTTRRIFDASDEERFTLLLIAESDEEAHIMDDQARLAVGADDRIDIIRARVHSGSPAMIAELIRRLGASFIVGRFGGIVFPAEGDLKPLAAVLECPLFLVR